MLQDWNVLMMSNTIWKLPLVRGYCLKLGFYNELADNGFDSSSGSDDGKVGVNLEPDLVAASLLLHLPPQVHHPGHLRPADDQVDGGWEEEVDFRVDLSYTGSTTQTYRILCTFMVLCALVTLMTLCALVTLITFKKTPLQVLLLSQPHLIRSLQDSAECGKLVWLEEEEGRDLIKLLDRYHQLQP